MSPKITLFTLIVLLAGVAFKPQKGTEGKASYLSHITAYADALIEHGRDTYGVEKSPLFASTLNRQTLQLDPSIDTISVKGVRKTDRSVHGGNLIHDKALFQLFYGLSSFSGDEKYAQEADQAIDFFFSGCQSDVTNFYCWGEHLYWDFHEEDCGMGLDVHETSVWPYWDKAYDAAPDAVWNYSFAEWEHQIHNKTNGDFSRHAGYTKHKTNSGFDFPRYAGQLMERWTCSYQRPENADKERREELLHFIKVMFDRMKDNMAQSGLGLLIAGRSSRGDHNQVVWLGSNLELARCLEIAAEIMEPGLAEEMRSFAIKQDLDFLKAPHNFDSVGGGFAVTLHAETGLPRVRSMNQPYSSTWASGYGYGTHAGVGNTIFGRHNSLKETHPEIASQYKDHILHVGRIYLESEPDTTVLLKPNEFAQVIKLMLNCEVLSGDTEFLDRAAYFADMGISLFLNGESPLPKVTNQHDHYESITGGPSFMYQLFKLHERRAN